MSQLKRLIMMAEDELTEYSTPARNIEKLRRKIGLTISASAQQEIRQALGAPQGVSIFSQQATKKGIRMGSLRSSDSLDQAPDVAQADRILYLKPQRSFSPGPPKRPRHT
ncbi:MAG: hypothetical protein Q6L60_05475 [Thermostichus sp. HHBFW_bins_43]